MEAYFRMKNTSQEKGAGQDKDDLMLLMMQFRMSKRTERASSPADADRERAREERDVRAAHELSVQMMQMLAALINPAAGLALMQASAT